MAFLNRYVIEGVLEAETAVHIGTGESAHHPRHDKAEIAAVAIGMAATAAGVPIQAPIIPGTALKNLIRRRLASRGITCRPERKPGEKPSPVEELLGLQDLGGKLVFSDAKGDTSGAHVNNLPDWDAASGTGVAANVSIDRVTRTAADERLFHRQVVPRATHFAVQIAGTNLSDDELETLLAALTDIDGSANSTVGAGGADGWGRVIWHQGQIRRMTAADVAAWVASGAAMMGGQAPQAVDSETQAALVGRSAGIRSAHPMKVLDALRLSLGLHFMSPFLVNDPSKTGHDPKPSHAPRRDHLGYAILPSSSFRGAFRSQAERIVRTISGEKPARCAAGSSKSGCKAVDRVEDLTRVCVVCWVCGATGWASPLSIADFSVASSDATAAGVDVMLQGVAIDRFTGGAAESKKFRTEAIRQPSLAGTVTLDRRRLVAQAGHTRWGGDAVPAALGLLALTLRDLREGDIRFGFGAAKGYGECRMSIRATQSPASPDEQTLLGLLQPGAPDPAVSKTVGDWVRSLHTVVGQSM